MSNNENQLLTKKDFVSDQEVRWCPGCGDYAILSSVQKVFPDLGIPKENFLIVSGIGCSSRFPYYMDTYGFHSIHGRAPAVATGAKIANPELSVWLVTGDGDAMSIGGNHFIHILRRNVDLNILMFNNQIYGLTKGQYSPTSEMGKVTKSTPMGSLDYPFNPPQLALGANGTFIARTIDRDQKHLGSILKEANNHNGTSFIEIYQNCNIFNDGAFSELTEKETKADTQLVLEHGQPMAFGLDNQKGLKLDGSNFIVVEIGDKYSKDDILVHNKFDRNLGMLLSGITYTPNLPVPLGILYQEQKPSYEQMLIEQIDESIKSKGKGDLQKTLLGTNHWTVN
jgi:2-oxoglutarate ferredoxin oxidoreductase subunit beta|tara:strand:- start:362 stop:1378 length:1017 start_codon:yes stop_codon:yes gene_type:complete